MTLIENADLTRLLIAILVLLGSASVCGYIFETLKMPRVIGEICGGLLLGRSVLGHFCPGLFGAIFNAFAYENQLLSMFYYYGLIMLMFISGLEQKKMDETSDKKLILCLVIATSTIPLILGWILSSHIDMAGFMGERRNLLALRIIFAISIAITSVPVISKIFIDTGIINTIFARSILTIAVVHDVLLWIGVAVATSIVKQGATIAWGSVLQEIVVILAFFLVSLRIVPRVIKSSPLSTRFPFGRFSPTAFALLVCLAFVIIASFFSINIMFGALLAGMVLGIAFDRSFDKIKSSIKEHSLGFSIPIYFCLVGLKIDLINDFDSLQCITYMLVSFAFIVVGVLPVTLLLKKDRLSSFNIMVSLNAKGGPGIVLATVAYDLKIISGTFFTTLVIAAILTSAVTGLWLRYVATTRPHLIT